MAGSFRFDRRRFLGASAAAAAGAGLGGGLALVTRARVELVGVDDGVFPDAPLSARLLGTDLPAGTEVRAFLRIRTPRERMALDLGASELAEDGTVPVQLRYPYANEFVVGDYTYHVELRWDGGHAMTTTPVRYTVRSVAWFA